MLKAEIKDDDPSLDGKKAYLEKLLDRKIELNVYDEKIEISKEDICSLYDLIDSDPILNEDHLDNYILKLAIENDGSSSYIDKPDLKGKLQKVLTQNSDESIEVNTISGQPVRRVEVKINEQTLYYYEDDKLTLKSPIVSGNKDITDETPHGKFEVRRKVEDTSLRGRDYIEHVDYWVGFDQTGGIYGLHDAQWRDEFGGDIWLHIDRGDYSAPEAAKLICEKMGQPEMEKYELEFMLNFAKLMTLLPAAHLLPRLKEMGKKLYIISNYGIETFAATENQFPELFSQFDGMVISAREKLIKPDRRIYDLLCSRYDLDPAECVFIDDLFANVQGAVDAGFKGIHYTGPEALE